MCGGDAGVREFVATNSETDAVRLCFCWADCALFFAIGDFFVRGDGQLGDEEDCVGAFWLARYSLS